MRLLIAPLCLLVACAALGCAHSAPSAALSVLPTAALAPSTGAPAAISVTHQAEPLATPSGAEMPLQGPLGLNLAQALRDPQYAAVHSSDLSTTSDVEDALLTAQDVASNPPSYRIDERTPYGVVVARRTAHTATIAWRTDVPTTGVIQYAKRSEFGKKGYTMSYTDTVAKTDHEIALTGLSRWTHYTYKITAITPLGLDFSDHQDRTFRTKFWSLN